MLKFVSIYRNSFAPVFCLILLCTLPACGLFGQTIWTSDQYLAFETGNENLPYQNNIDFLNENAKGMPLIDNYEFRTETDEMELARQRYQIRFQFNSSEERKAYNQILLANKDKYNWLQSKYQLDKVEERYKNIIDLYFNQRELEIKIQELDLLNDKKVVLERLLNNDNPGAVGDWISNENELLELRSDSLELELRRKQIAQKIFLSDRTAPELDGSDWIGVEDMQRVVDDVLDDESAHPDDGLVVAEENMANAEYQLEIAQGNKWLEFAQIEYQSDPDINFQREVSLGTSIIIPHKNNNRTRKNETALELLEKSYETYQEREERKNDLLQEEALFRDQIIQFEDFRSLREGQQMESMYDSYESQQLVSPLVLIDIRKLILSQMDKQLNLEKDIYNTYINILTLKAAFLANPEKNYLKINA